MEHDSQEPFESFAALRADHSRLLKAQAERGPGSNQPTAEAVSLFLGRARATGRRLDTPSEREAAQSAIDYWTATLFTLSGGTARSPTSSDGTADMHLLLEPFDAATVNLVVADAEAWFAALPPDRQANARRGLMRMVVLPAGGKAFVPAPVTRAALDSFGPADRIEAGLALLQAKKILRLTPGDSPGAGLIALRYEALMREWPRMAGWLDKRLRFRQAAHYWQANAQASAALIRDDLLDEAREYHDLDGVERDFIAASGKREREQDRVERHLHRWFVGLSAAAVVGAVAAVILLWVAYRAATAKGEAEKMQKEGMEAQALAESGSTLAMIDLLKKIDADSFHYAKKLLIIQTLGQMVSTASDPDSWKAAHENWVELEKDLKDPKVDDNEWFRTDFFPHGEKEGKPTFDERIARMTESPEASITYRADLLAISKFLKKWVQPRSGVKRRWYGPTTRTVFELSRAALEGKRIGDVLAFRDLFWRLYLGEMVLVESPEVEGKMVKFGDLLEEWEEGKGKASRDLANRMGAAAKELQEACDSEKGGRSGE